MVFVLVTTGWTWRSLDIDLSGCYNFEVSNLLDTH
jgi:hypothetical protein